MNSHFTKLITIFFLYSCVSKNKNVVIINDSAPVTKTIKIIENKRIYKYNDTVKFPWRTEDDSGYFKGYISEKIETETDTTTDTSSLLLNDFITRNVDRSKIKFLNDETLAHSVYINKKNKIRFDTLSNRGMKFVSIYKFGDIETQKIFFNGKIIRNYNPKENESSIADIIFLNEKSYRLFSFKGKKYCYFDANIPYTSGSVDNMCLQVIISLQTNKLSTFYSCRYSSAELYGDIDGDDNLDYINFDNSEFSTLIPSSDRATFRLYSINKNGVFIERKDKKNDPYVIEGNTGESYMQDSFNIKSFNWPVPIK